MLHEYIALGSLLLLDLLHIVCVRYCMLDIIFGVELYFFVRSGCLKGCLTWYGWENKFAFGLFGICSIVQSCLQKLLSIITSVTGVENITKFFVDDDGASYGSGCARVMVDSDVQVVMHRSTPDISGSVSFRSSPSLSFCNEMEEDSSVSLDNLRANWNPSQDQFFLELLLYHVHKGNKTGKAFSKQAWADMIEQFNTKFGFKHDVDVLKNRYKRFRKQYNEIKMIVSQNGFQWDWTLNMIAADDRTWSDYIKVHPDAQAFRTRVVPHYNDLCIIYGHAVADGRYSLSCFDVDFEYEENASKELDDHATTSKGVGDQTPPTLNQCKIDWSPMMDQFFVELMLDQVRKGNKIGRTFKKKAWVDMIESFNARFESHYGKVVLKNRLNVLRRHYCTINVLLAKEGFSWDKREQKVVADDQAWQKCIRVHHNYRLYRMKSMPFYSGMNIICRNEASKDCKSNLEKGSFGAKDTVPDPNAALHTYPALHIDAALHIGGENNLIRETQPFPNAALHIGGENYFIRETQPLPNAALHLGGENNLIRDTQPLPNADKEGGEKNTSRETQPLTNADDEAFLLHDSGHKKRHQPKMSPALKEPNKKARKSDEGMAVALKHMAVAVTSLTKKTKKKEDNFSVDNVVSVLQAIPGLDDDLVLDAIDFLEDERRARMFLALDANLRKKWLLRKLRSQ